jgi:RNA polymerase sigma factor (sigma-70 family)
MQLSPEFSRLIEKILKNANTEGDKDLKDYIRLVLRIARPYVRTRVEYEDLVMHGILGLLRARKKYDKERSPNFKTFAAMCIRGDIYAYCQNTAHLVSVPTHIAKASSYIGKMKKLLESTYGNTLEQDEVQQLIFTYTCEEENKLIKNVADKLKHYKDRLISIAKNSSLTYEALALLADSSLVATVSDSLLTNYKVKVSSVENTASENELQQCLLKSLGEKRYLVLKLHYEGYSNPEISKILFDNGYKNASGKAISRSAVKSLLDNSLHAIKNMHIFKHIEK